VRYATGHELSNADEYREKASFESGFRFEAGYSKPFVTMSDKDEFLRCIALHALHCACAIE
jgi:hypothetical protein